MELKDILKSVELFQTLNDTELEAVAQIFQERHLSPGETITQQGREGDEFFVVIDGFVEVIRQEQADQPRVLVNLGRGQIIGEMALVDRGPRSATVRALSDPTVVQVALKQDFEDLCERNTAIGYQVMKNIAADLSFKLRHQNRRV